MTAHDPHDAPPTGSAYATSFSPEVQHELQEEDTQAWTAIVSLLLGIISIGVILAIVCVLITTS